MSRLDDLQAKFPDIPRSIILKMDLLREGIRFTPALNEIGRWAIPHFLQWNPEHAFDVDARGEAPEDWLLTPWNLRLADGTTIKTRFWDSDAPYEIRNDGGRQWLFRDDEFVQEIFFHRRPGWLLDRASDGTVFGTVVQPWAPECWYAVSLRYCQYTKTGDQCRFCCLQPDTDGSGKGGQLAGLGYRVAMKPEIVAETFRRGATAGNVRHFAITGGAILNNTREIDRMAGVFRALNDVREELGTKVVFGANPSGLETHELSTLRDAGVDAVTINLEVWHEDLWPIVVPGKTKSFGRGNYLDSLKRAVDVYGDWKVNSYFVTGTETVPDCFKTPEAARDSVLDGVRWCLDHKVAPATTVWLPAPGSLWENAPEPSTEYYLDLGRSMHQLMKERGFYEALPPRDSCQCQECQDCSVNIDYYYQDELAAAGETATAAVCDALPPEVVLAGPSEAASVESTRTAETWIRTVLPERLAEDPRRAGGFTGAFALAITGDAGGQWTATIGDGQMTVDEGLDDAAAFSITMKDEHFVRMMSGDLSGQMAFLTGKIRLRGSMMTAMKLQQLLF